MPDACSSLRERRSSGALSTPVVFISDGGAWLRRLEHAPMGATSPIVRGRNPCARRDGVEGRIEPGRTVRPCWLGRYLPETLPAYRRAEPANLDLRDISPVL
jgi:hypothetical protein